MRRTRAVAMTALAVTSAMVLAACSSSDTGQQGAPTTTNSPTTNGGAAASGGAGQGSGAQGSGAQGSGAPSSGAGGGGDLGACGTPHGAWNPPAGTADNVNVSMNEGMTSWNSNTSHANSVYNSYPLYLTQAIGSYYDGDLKYVNNDSFLTCKVESMDPVTVTYTINKDAKWSDGAPITAYDMWLEWAALSGRFNTGEAQYDDDGNLVKTSAIAFDAASPGMAAIEEMPTISEDGQSMTVKYGTFYVDWQLNNPWGGALPSHVVAAKALGATDPAAGSKQLVETMQAFYENSDFKANKDDVKVATPKGANAKAAEVKKIADFWNTGFDFDQLPSDKSLYLSSGAYQLTDFKKDSYLTFKVNPNYTWGPKPQFQQITYQIIGDPMAAVQALQNGEVDVINPQATADVLTAAQALEGQGVKVLTGDGATYEHVDFAENNGGPFDPKTYGGDKEKAAKVRLAFMKTVPRQDIVDKLIKPLNPEATTRDSFNLVPGSPGYDKMIAENGSAEYKNVDIEGAKKLLAEAGVKSPKVRFMYAANNPRRAQEYKLIADSASQAGFQMVDGVNAQWSSLLPNTKVYDAALFGWQSNSTGVSSIPPNYLTDGQNNYYGYSNKDVDAALKKLNGTPLSTEEQQALILSVEQNLWKDGFGTVLFQFPEVLSYNSTNVEGIKGLTLVPSYFWNFWEWTKPGS
ncbi:ABC transporter family substrate-binding protein [Nakamurella aerolata]|uniref:ABC transporter family substrate-binding protein n=1 Tax=Nakamurella aerolata TaxID=1656892 RepID=A0A849AKI6_9ACTN|nr:ABC transporter family substrate-binding protein [Nakamurella aerolata]NNG37332.1 ABC transporter family substrate-binding protein [Nakamurella aerolata]